MDTDQDEVARGEIDVAVGYFSINKFSKTINARGMTHFWNVVGMVVLA